MQHQRLSRKSCCTHTLLGRSSDDGFGRDLKTSSNRKGRFWFVLCCGVAACFLLKEKWFANHLVKFLESNILISKLLNMNASFIDIGLIIFELISFAHRQVSFSTSPFLLPLHTFYRYFPSSKSGCLKCSCLCQTEVELVIWFYTIIRVPAQQYHFSLQLLEASWIMLVL